MKKISRGICLLVGMEYYTLCDIKFDIGQRMLYIITFSYLIYIKK